MLPMFILGVALLIGVLLLGRWYVSADPRTLVRIFKWSTLIVLLAVGLFLMMSGRLGWALFTLPVLIGWFMRFRAFARTARNFSRMTAASSDETSEVETRYFRMVLDHESGAMDGEVLEGLFQGRRLNDLAEADLLSLLAEYRANDEQSFLVLQAYLDRVHPDWRDRDGHTSGTGTMDRQQALEVLGLSAEATEADIKDAHHRLMAGLHPDHGGSTYLASKINQAKDFLLGN